MISQNDISLTTIAYTKQLHLKQLTREETKKKQVIECLDLDIFEEETKSGMKIELIKKDMKVIPLYKSDYEEIKKLA